MTKGKEKTLTFCGDGEKCFDKKSRERKLEFW